MLTPELRFMLLALRAQIEAILLSEGIEERERQSKCAHPPEDRVSTAAMGKPDAFRCNQCGYDSEVGG
jgi:hypothetical protein